MVNVFIAQNKRRRYINPSDVRHEKLLVASWLIGLRLYIYAHTYPNIFWRGFAWMYINVCVHVDVKFTTHDRMTFVYSQPMYVFLILLHCIAYWH